MLAEGMPEISSFLFKVSKLSMNNSICFIKNLSRIKKKHVQQKESHTIVTSHKISHSTSKTIFIVVRTLLDKILIWH